jgi:hypothetical protein
MENGELKMENAWGMEAARGLLIIFHLLFSIRAKRATGRMDNGKLKMENVVFWFKVDTAPRAFA